MVKRDVGLGSIIRPGRSLEEIRKDELEEFYKKEIEPGFKTTVPVEDKSYDPLELPSLTLTGPLPHKKSIDKPRNNSGHTEAQKRRLAHQWTVRPPNPIKKMVEKAMPITTYISKINKLYGSQDDKQIKQLEALKEYGRNPYTYKSKLDTMVDQYGNEETATSKIQRQEEARKKNNESEKKADPNKRRFR